MLYTTQNSGGGSWSKSKSGKSKHGSQGGTGDIVAVSQMSLDGMTVQECLAMGDFMSRSCTDCSIVFNKCKLCDVEPCDSGGAVFIYNQKAYDKVKDNLEEYKGKFPLKCEDYPISNNEEKMTAVLASNAISVRDYKSETMSHCIMDVMNELKITKLPPNPPCPKDHSRRLGHDATSIAEALADPYWDELGEVLEYQLIRIMNGNDPASAVFPTDFPLPAIWTGYTVNQVTQAVSAGVNAGEQGRRSTDLMLDSCLLFVLFRCKLSPSCAHDYSPPMLCNVYLHPTHPFLAYLIHALRRSSTSLPAITKPAIFTRSLQACMASSCRITTSCPQRALILNS